MFDMSICMLRSAMEILGDDAFYRLCADGPFASATCITSLPKSFGCSSIFQPDYQSPAADVTALYDAGLRPRFGQP